MIDRKADFHGHVTDYVGDQDRAFFAAHPEMQAFERPAFPHEFCDLLAGGGPRVCFDFEGVVVRVTCMGDGVRARQPLWAGMVLPLIPPRSSRSMFVGSLPNEFYSDYSRSGVLRSLDDSRQRLGMDYIDIVHVHDPDMDQPDHYRETVDEAFPALAELRERSEIGAVSVGINQWQMLVDFARDADFDCFMLAGRYTLLEQGALETLFPLCLERRISVLAAGVFNSGILADPRPGAYHDYGPVRPHILERALRIQAVCIRHGVPIKAAAMQFPLAHPVVACVVVGARSAQQQAENARLIGLPIPSALWDELKSEGLIDPRAPVPSDPKPPARREVDLSGVGDR